MKLSVDSGASVIKLDGKAALKGLRLTVFQTDRELAIGGERIIPLDPEKVKGEDAGGKFTGSVSSFKLDYEDSKGRHWDMAVCRMEVRVYEDFFAVRTSAKVDSLLKEDGHFRVDIGEIIGLDNLLALSMTSDWWSKPFFGTDISKLPLRIQMLLWQRDDGLYGCLVPLVNGGAKCQLNARTGTMGADVIFYDSGYAVADSIAFVGAFGENPYELVYRCAARGMAVSGNPGKLRHEKPYPQMYSKLGWCTWNSMYDKVNERDMLKKMAEFAKEKLPVKWVLVDDGWSPLDEHRQLAGFGTDTSKFPLGFRPLVSRLKEEFGVNWVGVWHTFTGYWRGISQNSDIYKDNRLAVFDSKKGVRIPYPDVNRGFQFWNAWHTELRNQGIEFVKVDNQGATYHYTQGAIPVGNAARGQQYALQASAGLNFSQGILNCMCMLSENIWHWVSSNVARNSDDFFPNRLESGPDHARQNIYNNLFFANFAWPDWDMWQSHHPLAEYHAAMRAISGGPIYFTDEVGKGDYKYLWPLVLSDGTLLGCDQPAMPTRDSLFLDPAANPVAVKCYNRTGKAGMLLAIHATDGDVSVKGKFRPADIEGLEGKLFGVREYFTNQTRLMKRGQTWDFELKPGQVLLFSVVPVEGGAAVIGLAEKYVSPATVISTAVTSGGYLIRLAEGGSLVAYFEKEISEVRVKGKPVGFTQVGGWFTAAVVSGAEAVDVELDAS